MTPFTSMIKIIGISGKKQAGKDTLCSAIREHYKGQSERIAFADALKEEVAKATGVTLDFIEANKPHFRLLLQAWGTDFRRWNNGENYWVAQAFKKMLDLPYSVNLIVVPDVRFRSEADYIRECGGHIIRVTCFHESSSDGHQSEVELDNYEHFYATFSNAGSINLVHDFARTLLKQLNLQTK